MVIKTNRLELVALTAPQMELWLNDLPALERELNCVYMADPMEGFFLDIVKGQYKITLADPDNYYWHSFFFIIRISDRVVVGSADFKSAPDDNGEAEIGYGLGKQFEHNGYMSETVAAMCRWALSRDDVSSVIAETEPDNLASQRILERCGFRLYKSGESLWWRKRKA